MADDPVKQKTAPTIPNDARPVGEVEMLMLLLSVRAWANMQSRTNTEALYAAALRYWGVSPVIPE